MGEKKYLVILAGLVFILTTVLIIGSVLPIAAGESCNIVTIHGRSGVNPKTIAVSKGDCVIWMNWTRDEDVSLSFKEGEKCLSATESQKGFKLDRASSCFIAQELKYGDTVSLVFAKPGTYAYDIMFKVGGSTTGTIIVEE